MSIGQYISRAAALGAIAWAVAGIAQADVRPSSLQLGWQPVWVEQSPVLPERRPEVRHELLAQWGALPPVPPEQRQQMRQQMREHWQQMPPEPRGGRRQEAQGRWQQMPVDERQRIREEMRERGSGYGEGRHRH